MKRRPVTTDALPRFAAAGLLAALGLAGCASTGADIASLAAATPDVCTPAPQADAAQRAVAAACAPRPGDQVTPAERRQAVRLLAAPLERLNTQRHQRVAVMRSRSAPEAAASTITTDIEPGGRKRTLTLVPAAVSQRVEMLQVGHQGWVRVDGGRWQPDASVAAPEHESAAVLAQSAILALRSHSEGGRRLLVVDTRDDGLGFRRERRIHADLTRGLITQMDFVDMDDLETTLRYDWDSAFAPITAPVTVPSAAPSRATPARPARRGR